MSTVEPGYNVVHKSGEALHYSQGRLYPYIESVLKKSFGIAKFTLQPVSL